MNLKIICCGDFNAHLQTFIPYETNLPGMFMQTFLDTTNLKCIDPD